MLEKSGIRNIVSVAPNAKLYQQDLLARFTVLTKTVIYFFANLLNKFEQSKYFKTLSRTTQPAHLVVLAAVAVVLFFLNNTGNNDTGTSVSSILKFVSLTAFCTLFGTQIWMSFFSGLRLYFSLPRHAFGAVQKLLFPMYFLLNSILSFVVLIIFIASVKEFTNQIIIQTVALFVMFITFLIILLYVTKPLVKLITAKNEIELAAGVGSEVGKLNLGDLEQCPKYMKLHYSFRKLHMAIAIGNVIANVCSFVHLYYLSLVVNV